LGPWALTVTLETLEFLGTHFKTPLGNRKPSYSPEYNSMTPSHAVKARFNQLFRQKIDCFSKKLENGFEIDPFLLSGLNPSPALPK